MCVAPILVYKVYSGSDNRGPKQTAIIYCSLFWSLVPKKKEIIILLSLIGTTDSCSCP